VAIKNGIITDEINAVMNVVKVAINGEKNAEELTPPSKVVKVSSIGNMLSISNLILLIVLVTMPIIDPTCAITSTIIALYVAKYIIFLVDFCANDEVNPSNRLYIIATAITVNIIGKTSSTHLPRPLNITDRKEEKSPL
jgi:hypothetical protein